MIYMLWKECIPADFQKFICKEEHFLHLNGKNILCSKIAEIVQKFIDKNEKNYNQLRNNLCQFKKIFQYVCSIAYPETYCTTECRVKHVVLIFKAPFSQFLRHKYKKKLEHLGKEPSSFIKERNETFKFEQNLRKLTISITWQSKKLTKQNEKRKKKT